jgi:hypothetical protein
MKELIRKLRNVRTGEVVFTSNFVQTKVIDGKRFITVWNQPATPADPRVFKLMAEDTFVAEPNK